MFHLVTGYAETLHRELIERNVDLLVALRYGAIADERLDCETLFDDSYSFAVGVAAPDRASRTVERAVGAAVAGKPARIDGDGVLSR